MLAKFLYAVDVQNMIFSVNWNRRRCLVLGLRTKSRGMIFGVFMGGGRGGFIHRTFLLKEVSGENLGISESSMGKKHISARYSEDCKSPGSVNLAREMAALMIFPALRLKRAKKLNFLCK